MPDIADKPIFGRYSREDCGLPPAGEGKSGWRGLAARTGALLLLLVAAGWAAGIFAAR